MVVMLDLLKRHQAKPGRSATGGVGEPQRLTQPRYVGPPVVIALTYGLRCNPVYDQHSKKGIKMSSPRVRSFSGSCTWILSFLCLLAQVFLQTAGAQSLSSFAPIKLPRGIELQVPQGWQLLGADYKRAIDTSAEAAMDLSGIALPQGHETNLIMANSLPRATYAALSVDSTTPPPLAPSRLISMTSADLLELETEMRQGLQKLLPLQGSQLIEFLGSHIETISGHSTLVTEYRRTGKKGPVFVQINQILTPNQEIRINLSYRESEVALWKPVIGKIRKSIIVRRWP